MTFSLATDRQSSDLSKQLANDYLREVQFEFEVASALSVSEFSRRHNTVN